MPTDTLGDEAQAALKSALDFIRLDRPDERKRRNNLLNLESIEARLRADIEERVTGYSTELQSKEDDEIDSKWRELNEDPQFIRANAEQKARQQTFESLRQVNDGGFPFNRREPFRCLDFLCCGSNGSVRSSSR
jgi:hypothetical protein